MVKEYEAADEMTVFQSAELQKMYSQNAWIYALRSRSLPVTYAVYDNGKPALVFPALQGQNKITLAGAVNGICSLCPIYFNATTDYASCLEYLLSNIPADEIQIGRLFTDSPTASMIEGLGDSFEIERADTENVRIVFESSYDEWFAGLKKSVRQNLRTAYNRANTDGLSVRFETWQGGEVPSQIMHEFVRICNDRHADHYGVKTSSMKRLYMQYVDFSTRSLRTNPNARHGALWLDDRIAAFYSGYYDKKSHSIAIPRLSIDPQYQRYSPGYLLISEAIKVYSADEAVTVLDLSTGTEKYKLDLGGTVYLKSNFTLRRKVQNKPE